MSFILVSLRIPLAVWLALAVATAQADLPSGNQEEPPQTAGAIEIVPETNPTPSIGDSGTGEVVREALEREAARGVVQEREVEKLERQLTPVVNEVFPQASADPTPSNAGFWVGSEKRASPPKKNSWLGAVFGWVGWFVAFKIFILSVRLYRESTQPLKPLVPRGREKGEAA